MVQLLLRPRSGAADLYRSQILTSDDGSLVSYAERIGQMLDKRSFKFVSEAFKEFGAIITSCSSSV